MKGRKHTPEQIVRKLREADRMAGERASLAEVAKAMEVSEVRTIAENGPAVMDENRTTLVSVDKGVAVVGG